MNYILSSGIGVLALGWLHLSYLYLFDYLYVFLSVKPKIEYCRELIQSDLCSFIAYASLWAMELPLLLFSFITFSGALILVKYFFTKIYINNIAVILCYIISYLALTISGPYGSGNVTFILFTALYHGLLFSLCMLAVKHLTSILNIVTAKKRPPLDSA